jgi:hypothetical protein
METLTISTSRWLEIFPKGTFRDKDFLSVYLYKESETKLHVYFKVSLIDDCGDAEFKQFVYCPFGPGRDNYGIERIVSRELLFDKRASLLQNDTLTMNCEVQLLESAEEIKFNLDKIPSEEIFRQKKFSDVSVMVKDCDLSIKAHKVFLVTCSPGFEEMLVADESKKVLELEGFDFEVIEELINFLYYDTIDWAKMDKLAEPLLRASEKVLSI